MCVDRFSQKEDTQIKIDKFNDKTRLYESNNRNNDASIKIKRAGKDPIYKEKKRTIGTMAVAIQNLKNKHLQGCEQ